MSTAQDKRLVILTAVGIEASAVARAFGLRRVGKRHWQSAGNANGSPKGSNQSDGGGMEGGVEVWTVGMRGVVLPGGLGQARGVILAGLAGGLDPQLKVGDIIVDEDSQPLPTLARPTWRIGKMTSSEGIVATPAEKAELFRSTAALAVEMEKPRVWSDVDRRGVPRGHVRAISDTAGDYLDSSVFHLVDSFGKIRLLPMVGGIFRNPGRLFTLHRLGKNARRATANLADALLAIVQSGWPHP